MAAVPTAGRNGRPTAKSIAYVTGNGQPFFYYANRYIAAIPAEGGTPRVLTQDFDEDPNLIDWGPDGIYFAALQKTNAHIFRLDPATRAVQRITGPDQFHASGATFTKDHRTLAGSRRRAQPLSRRFSFPPPPISRPSISATSPRSGRTSN